MVPMYFWHKLGWNWLGSKLSYPRAAYSFRYLRSLHALARPATSIIAQIGVEKVVLPWPALHVRMASDEVSKAQEAAKTGGASSEPTIFARILNREIPANIIYEDDKVYIILAISCHRIEVFTVSYWLWTEYHWGQKVTEVFGRKSAKT